MTAFAIGFLAALLPRRYRRWIQVGPSAAVMSGIVQLLFCLAIFIYRYLRFARTEVFGGTQAGLKAMESGGETAVLGSGIFVLMEYMIQPVTLLLVYFAFEGVVRAIAAFVNGEILPTLPLAAFAWIHGRASEARAERAMGERIPDEVEAVDTSDIKLRIHSCRPKPSWDDRVTIFYMDKLYEVAGEEVGQDHRRFVYLLRCKPDNKIVRGIHHYDPTEVLSR